MSRGQLTFDQWIVIIPLLASSVTGTVVAIITAVRQGHKVDALHHEIKPPSNSQTAGELLEGINQAATAAALEATRVRQALKKKGSTQP